MRVFSGIQPTGSVHLGNYFGALVNWVRLQEEGHACIYSLANLHTITLPQDPPILRKRIMELAAILIAVGIDPEKSILFVQSDVSEHANLSWVLGCLAPVGEMERMIQFKEKSESHPEAVNAGLFSYPILQAADILLYKTDLVPVGVDQAQHLELARDLAKKFNRLFGPVFVEPRTLHTPTTKVVGLDGSAKMSKSKDNYIALADAPDEIWGKLSQAATDPARVRRSDPGNPYICNIYALHGLFSSEADKAWVVEGCQTAGIGCIDCKKRLFTNMNAVLEPFRDRYHELMKRPDDIRDILRHGAGRASTIARATLSEVYQAIGFDY